MFENQIMLSISAVHLYIYEVFIPYTSDYHQFIVRTVHIISKCYTKVRENYAFSFGGFQ